MMRVLKPRFVWKFLVSYHQPFSKIEEQISMAGGRLRNQVLSEYKHEYQTYEPQELTSMIEDLGFVLNDDKHSSKIELNRSFKRATVSILFQATRPLVKAPVDEVEDEEDDTSDAIQKQVLENENRDDSLETPNFSVDFTVYIRAKSGETISYECNSQDQKININYVTFIYDLEEHLKLSKVERLLNIYNGPIFNSLDERLQSGLRDYLQSFGVTPTLAPIVESLALDKEQRLYMDFLKKMDNFLS